MGIYLEDSIVRGIEWDRGIYLGNDLSEISIDSIQKEYAASHEAGWDENSMDEEQEC